MYVGPARATEVQWQPSRQWMPGAAVADYPVNCLLSTEAGPQWAVPNAASRCGEVEYLSTTAVGGDGANFCDYAPPQVASASAEAVASTSYWRTTQANPADVSSQIRQGYFNQMEDSRSSIPGSANRSQPSSNNGPTYWNSEAMTNGGSTNESQEDGDAGLRWSLTAQAGVSVGVPDCPYVVQFDPYEELVWVGTLGGRMQSYILQWHNGLNGHGGGAAEISPYTRFPAHNCAICHVLFDDRGVISVGEENLAYHQRGGLPMPFLDDSARTRMTSSQNALRYAEWYGGKQIIVGSAHAKLFFVDVGSGRLSATLDAPHGTQTMCAAHGSNGEASYVVVGGNDGQISVVDRRKKDIVRTLRAHASSVTAMAEQGGTLVTCGGTSNPQTGMYMPDMFIKVFDLRRLEQGMPVQFNAAVQARFHPLVPNSLAILSNSGAFQTCELSAGRVYNTRYNYCRSSPTDGAIGFDMSSNGECIVIADSSCLLQLWQTKGRPPKINYHSLPVEVPLVRPEPLYSKLMDDAESPFSMPAACPHGCPSLGGDVNGDPLLSVWPGAEKCMRFGREPVPIHPDVAANLQMNDFVGCTQNTYGWRQNSAVSVVRKVKQSKHCNGLVNGKKLSGRPWLSDLGDDAVLCSSGQDCSSPSEAMHCIQGVENLLNEAVDDDG